MTAPILKESHRRLSPLTMEVEAANWGSDAQLLGRLERFEQNVDMLTETVLEVCFQSQTESFLCKHTEHPPCIVEYTHTHTVRVHVCTRLQAKNRKFVPSTYTQRTSHLTAALSLIFSVPRVPSLSSANPILTPTARTDSSLKILFLQMAHTLRSAHPPGTHHSEQMEGGSSTLKLLMWQIFIMTGAVALVALAGAFVSSWRKTPAVRLPLEGHEAEFENLRRVHFWRKIGHLVAWCSPVPEHLLPIPDVYFCCWENVYVWMCLCV